MLVICCMLLFHACISEDLSRCPPTIRLVRIYFSYTVEGAVAQASITPADVDRINLFAFDKNGKFYGEWIDESPHLSPDYYIEASLAEGSYTLVVWGGLRASYIVTPNPMEVGVSKIGDSQLKLIRGADGTVTTTSHQLFFGNLLQVVVRPEENQIFRIGLEQNTNRINLRTEGFSASGDVYSLTITDDNGRYFFDNSFAPDERISYTTPCAKDAQSQLSASLTVMRLDESRPHPILTLFDETTSQIVFQANLIELLLKVASVGGVIDFNTTHEFDIVLSFNPGLGITIIINGWNLTEDNQQIN